MTDPASLRTDTPERPFQRLLIANRGEIAIRVIRACRELGISPIAIHSDADADALHVRAADRSERIGPPPATESYLSVPAVIDAARRSGAEAIHPGYGFLSENADFARAVEEAGLVFIGPPPSALEALGNKLAARRSAADAGVPIVPGTTVALDDDMKGVADIGFPVMLKAAAGGGGRGMRRVDRAEDLAPALAAARREATSAFGDGTIYVERMVAPARHVEVQLLGDRHGGLAVLGERDCSVQRRHQKLVEESPSPAVDDATRAALFDSARRVARTVDFHNAATVEFLLDADGNHYFLEMNTRLQVEHGVTELVTGIDLVAWQIRVAAGERLGEDVLDAPRRGHAIEVRLYAEDPYDGFRPTSGRIGAWRMPEGPGVRVDAGIEQDTDLRPEYDPLLVKLMVHAADRGAAVDRLRRALDEMLIGGLQTDAGFLRWLVDDEAFRSGDYDTSLIAARWRDGPALTDAERRIAATAAITARRMAVTSRPVPVARKTSSWGDAGRREALR
ncbi:MAG TPA: biotin carboxylase N-terminal domain-containing protein [Candidatus Limnocylindria bacterium]|nr:biotin carboxylase N-terminal domain-containing protein [Candidatus Limnocylindria bacterium]